MNPLVPVAIRGEGGGEKAGIGAMAGITLGPFSGDWY